MNLFWSFWIIIITVGTLLGLFFILRWCLNDSTGIEEGTDMGHEYDRHDHHHRLARICMQACNKGCAPPQCLEMHEYAHRNEHNRN